MMILFIPLIKINLRLCKVTDLEIVEPDDKKLHTNFP